MQIVTESDPNVQIYLEMYCLQKYSATKQWPSVLEATKLNKSNNAPHKKAMFQKPSKQIRKSDYFHEYAYPKLCQWNPLKRK